MNRLPVAGYRSQTTAAGLGGVLNTALIILLILWLVGGV
jgi:hypothetical protein